MFPRTYRKTKADHSASRHSCRSQLNSLRCSRPTQVLGDWDSEGAGYGYFDSIPTAEPIHRRRTQPQGMGQETTES